MGAILDLLRRNKQTLKTNDAVIDRPFNPLIVGSVRALIGSPGSGKTRLGTKLALRSGINNGVPCVMQDTLGEAREYIDRMIYNSSGAKRYYLENCVAIVDSVEGKEFIDYIEKMGKKVRLQKRHTCTLFIDEAAHVNEWYEIDDGHGGIVKVDFWSLATKFRNYGMTGYVSCQLDTSISRKGRQAVGAVLFMRPTESIFDMFGKDIDTTKLCDPVITGRVPWVSSRDKIVREWDMWAYEKLIKSRKKINVNDKVMFPDELFGLVNITQTSAEETF